MGVTRVMGGGVFEKLAPGKMAMGLFAFPLSLSEPDIHMYSQIYQNIQGSLEVTDCQFIFDATSKSFPEGGN